MTEPMQEEEAGAPPAPTGRLSPAQICALAPLIPVITVERAEDAGLAFDEAEHVALVESMIAEREDIRACIKKRPRVLGIQACT